MGRFCLFAYTELTERFRRGRGFLPNSASLLKLFVSEKKQRVDLEKLDMMKNKINFPNKNVGSAFCK